jgi:hypothetical protein
MKSILQPYIALDLIVSTKEGKLKTKEESASDSVLTEIDTLPRVVDFPSHE